MKKFIFSLTMIALCSCFIFASCEHEQQKSDSGITKATVKLTTGPDGLTVEQRNISERLKRDNEIGSVKHLYIVSAYTGDVLQYSTVKGKVTSGNKRLSPKTINGDGYNHSTNSNWVQLGSVNYTTDEVLDDGGTYGDSGNYLFWFDAQGNYQQYYPSGGTYLQISDRPLRMRKSSLSLELTDNTTRPN